MTVAAVLASAAIPLPVAAPLLLIGGLALLGAHLAWTSDDRDSRWGDVGRSLLLGALLAFAFGVYDRRDQERQKEEAFRQTISLQQTLKGADFSEDYQDDLSELQLVGKDLSDTNLRGTNLSDTNLTGANLSGAALDQSDLSGADLTDANLTEASLDEANLDDAHLDGAILLGADLEDASLRSATLLSANLRGSCLARADLTGADLAGADLFGAQFALANLSQVVFEEDYRAAEVGPEEEDGLYLPIAGFHEAMNTDEIIPASFNLPGVSETLDVRVSIGPPPSSDPKPVEEIADGDNVMVNGKPVRLIGIDAPPLAEPLGRSALEFVRDALLGQDVVVEKVGVDGFDRNLAFVWVDGESLNQILIEEGHAVYQPHDLLTPRIERELLQAEEIARASALGVWADCPPT